MPHQRPSYKGLEKRALRMLNGLLTFYYGTLNSGCYDGDGAPGGGLSMRTYSLPRVTEGAGSTPLLRNNSGPPSLLVEGVRMASKKRAAPARLTDPSLLGYLRRR